MATMVTHCTYNFSVNAFHIINHVTISVSTPCVKKCLVSRKQKALRPRVNVHTQYMTIPSPWRNKTYFHIFAIRALKSFVVKNITIQELELGDTDTYRNVLFMDTFNFEELLSLAEPQIIFHGTHLLKAIPPGKMSWFAFSAVHVAAIILCVCLWWWVNFPTKFTHSFQ